MQGHTENGIKVFPAAKRVAALYACKKSSEAVRTIFYNFLKAEKNKKN